MESRISQALAKLFERHRIVFWYDSKQELWEEYEALSIKGVEKLEITNNEFGLKYRILRQEPKQKFLLYKKGAQPEDLQNWLLDVQLAQGEFRTDQAAIWLAELELGLEFSDIIENHIEFFRSGKRREALKKLLTKSDGAPIIRQKMLAVCAGSEPRTDSILENLLAEHADKREEKIKLIGRCNLDAFLWEQMTRYYGYSSNEPGIRDFVIELFKSCYAMGTQGKYNLTGDALVFLKRWKDSRQYEASFEALSADCSEILSIEQDLEKRGFRDVLELDYFQLIDRKIISNLVREIVSRTVSSTDISSWVRQRRQSHWYQEFQHLYEAIDHAAQFINTLEESNLTMDSLADGIQRYSNHWFKLDQLYRKFTYHVRCSGQASLMGALSDQIENLYSNNYLMKVNDRWQPFVDNAKSWDASPVPLQKQFFERWVKPLIGKGKKVHVLISDAFRYEIGDELLSLIRKEDRYEATLEPALSMLPSFTQLGMAALLPNKELSLADNDTGTVLVNGQSSQGITNRIKILDQAIPKRATAIKAEELMTLNKDESRALIKDHDVIYIYHNRIDATGDKRESEDRVFEAVDETLNDLIRLIKKLFGDGISNLFITSDHGFIYQNRAIDESDFATGEPNGEQVFYRDRRFVLGKGLNEVASLRKFQSSELGLVGDIEVQIPKSINRLRLKGSGSRFVHGGAALQEVVIPIVKISKKRQSDTSKVEVDILRGASSTITSGQLAVGMYQAQPATEKVQPRTLQAGIYTLSEELISDSQDLTFDFASENPRDREVMVRFVLTRKADEANNQEVILKLLEKETGTSHYKEYKSLRYVMRRSFTSDFDF
ncbi:BREX-1 system phosphatase PglZ type A [Vampirovibrio sp.]|uniref:BREX-1 system phosphatase PglZ type A n=1 Tax=Vampirovibrio sp. TaxID=2717857 RepID=UPI003594650A